MTTTYATQVTSYFLAAIAAAEAGGSPVNLIGGTLVVGDGNGAVPALSALIAANGVTHEVWRGTTINSVSVDANNAAQLDVQVMIPAAIGGVEIGPFTVREFAILDSTGGCCIVGTTNLEKTTSAQGQVSDLLWIAAVVNGVGQVTITPPSSTFLTIAQLISFWNANLPTAAAPITQADTVSSAGVKERVFGARLASQPADPVTAPLDANAIGVGRPASAAEFAAFAPTAGRFAWPWATLQQIGAAITAVKAWVSGLFLPLVGGTLSGNLAISAATPQLALDNTGTGSNQGEVTFEQSGTPVWGINVPYSASGPHLKIVSSSAGAAIDIDYLTGRLSLISNPTAPLGAATKQYADGSRTTGSAGSKVHPDGTIEQWAKIAFGAGTHGPYRWYFPTSFPNGVGSINATDTADSGGTNYASYATDRTVRTNSYVDVYCSSAAGAVAEMRAIGW